MQLKKFLSAVVAAVCLCSAGGVSVYADNSVSALSLEEEIAPAYDEIAQDVRSSLSISGTSATCTSRVDSDDCVSISVTHTLQKYSGWFWAWDDVSDASWSKTVNTNTICFISTKSSLTSGKYRVKSVCTLTDENGNTETVTVYSNEASVS